MTTLNPNCVIKELHCSGVMFINIINSFCCNVGTQCKIQDLPLQIQYLILIHYYVD